MKRYVAIFFYCLIGVMIFAQENLNTLTKEKVDDLCMAAGMTREIIQKISIPENYIEIGDSAFENCSNLTQINIPPKITKIGDYAFGKTKIEDLILPETIVSIGKYSFGKCNNLFSIKILAKTPPDFSLAIKGRHDEFYTGDLAKKVLIFVPDESVNLYKDKWAESDLSYFQIYPLTGSDEVIKLAKLKQNKNLNELITTNNDSKEVKFSDEKNKNSSTAVVVLFICIITIIIVSLKRKKVRK